MAAPAIEPRTWPTRGPWPEWLGWRVALSFVLVACLAFSWGWWQRSKRRLALPCQATAVVYHELPPEWASLTLPPPSPTPNTAQGANHDSLKPLVAMVREMALLPSALQKAGQPAQCADVEVKRIAGPDGLKVAICCEGASAERAALAADVLAQSYAEQIRTRWHEQAQRRCRTAQAAAAQARDELLKAQARLDLFVQGQDAAFAQGGPSLDAPTTPDPGAAAGLNLETPEHGALPPRAGAALPQIKRGRPPGHAPGEQRIDNNQSGAIENPRWGELNDKVEQLRKRLAELLETRTAAHPLVQQAEQDLQAAQARLAEEPQWLAAEKPEHADSPAARPPGPLRVPNPYVPAESPTPSPATEASVREGGAGEDNAATAARVSPASGPTVAELRRGLEQAWAAFDRAAGREREAWEAASREPRIEREPARVTAPLAPLPVWRLAVAAVLAGLVGAGGVGLISAGARIQPVLRTAAEAEAAVGAPLAVCIPATALGVDPEAEQQAAQPEWARPALMLAGLGLLAAGLAGAWVWIR